MDFGLDGLIQMFEERFGRRATTALLALIYLGVASWAIHAIVDFVITPLVTVMAPVFAVAHGLTLSRGRFGLRDAIVFVFLLGSLGYAARSFVKFSGALRDNPELKRLSDEYMAAIAKYQKAEKEYFQRKGKG